MDVLKLLNDWLEEKRKNDWCESTYRSEKRRLTSLVPYLTGDAEVLWREFEARETSMYSRLTALIRITSFWDYYHLNTGSAPPGAANPYRRLHQQKRRLLKNCYQEKIPEISFEAAYKKIQTIADDHDRKMALLLITTGMRFTESTTIKDNKIIGKGAKPRRVYPPEQLDGFIYQGTYDHFYYALKSQTGLKPHDLRKIFLSKIANNGMNHFELCRVAGWSNINTATKYISVSNDRIKALIETARKVS